jgi:hypothetical protein
VSPRPRLAQHDLRWQTSNWKADDREFLAIRREIEAQTNPKELERIIDAFKAKSAKGVLTPREACRWGTAVVVRSTGDYAFGRRMERDNNLRPLESSMYGAFAGDSFEFTRLRFLLCVAYVFPNPGLIPLGQRLHKRDPADLRILRALVLLQQPQAFPDSLPNGRALAEKLLSQDPDHITSLLCAGRFYLLAHEAAGRPEDAQRALALHRKALAVSPDPDQKRIIQSQIDRLTKALGG